MNKFALTMLALLMATPALAIDSIPLDQLRPGLWKVERKMEKLDLNPVEYETRNSEYCADPKKELGRTLKTLGFLCKTNVTRLAANKYQAEARCNLGPISGSNTTTITFISPDEYTADVNTIGVKFGEKQHRKEQVTAVRTGDCKE